MNDVQKCILNIYKEIKKVCDKNDITYYGAFGTCLGAVRDKGFIPWDDDIDLIVPIEDYFLLIEKLKEELPEHFEVYTIEEGKHYNWFILKVIDTRTTYIGPASYKFKDSWTGVWVDVFPFFGGPKGKLSRRLFNKKLESLFIKNYSMNYAAELNLSACSIFNKNKLLGFYGKVLKKIHNENRLFYYNKFKNIIVKYPVNKSKLVGWQSEFNLMVKPVESSYFLETEEVPFEDTYMIIPKKYDEFLTKCYGNYMKYPDVEKRTIHPGIIDLQTSYTEYVKDSSEIDDYLRGKILINK